MRRSPSQAPQHAFDSGDPAPRPRLDANGRQMEIGLGQHRRIWGRIGYWFIFLLVGLLFVHLFERLTGSRSVAVVAVSFMVGYMLLAAHFTTKALRQTPGSSGLG